MRLPSVVTVSALLSKGLTSWSAEIPKTCFPGKGQQNGVRRREAGPLQHRVRPRVPPGLTVPEVTCKREHGTRTCGSGAGCRPGGGGGTGPRRPRDPRSSGGVAFRPARSPAAGTGGQKTGETPQASGRHVCECSAELGRDPGLRRPGWGRGFAGVQGDRPPAVMEGEPAGVAPTPRRPVLLGRVSAPSDAQRVVFLQELFPSSSPPRPVAMLGHRSPGLRLWAPGTASLAAPHRGLTSSDPPAVCLNHAGRHFIC